MKHTFLYATGIGAALLLLPLQSVRAQETKTSDSGTIATSVDLRDAPVRRALEQLFREARVDFVIASDVEGTITMNLKDLPFEQVLKIICRTNTVPLTYTKEGKRYEVKVRKAPTPSAPVPTIEEVPTTSSLNLDPIHLKFLDPRQLQGIIGNVIMIPSAFDVRNGAAGNNQNGNPQGNNNQSNPGGIGGDPRNNIGFQNGRGGSGLLLGSGNNLGNGGNNRPGNFPGGNGNNNGNGGNGRRRGG
jgi:hypothetical protein